MLSTRRAALMHPHAGAAARSEPDLPNVQVTVKCRFTTGVA
jgi:hypothetical protein